MLDSCDEDVRVSRETGDCQTDGVPYGTRAEDGTRTIKKAELLSMFKYLLNYAYGNGRQRLYRFIETCLRDGSLSEIVGFKILPRKVNRKNCDFRRADYWQLSRERFLADVEVRMELISPAGPRVWEGILVCECGFTEDGYQMSPLWLTRRTDRKEEGFVGLDWALVPVCSNREMDEEANRIWTEYGMREALWNPDARKPEELAERMGLTVRYLDVYDHRQMSSIVFFADGELSVGEDRTEKQEDGSVRRHRTETPHTELIPAGTIVVNTNIVRKKSYAAFSIFHECIHYRMHYLFYRLQDLASNDRRLLKVTETEAEEGTKQKDPLYYMEKQANRGAYALMMPAADTCARIEKERTEEKTYRNAGEKYEVIGKRLHGQMGYPYFRIKARMIQLGYPEARGALNYDDDSRPIRPFGFDTAAWRGNNVTYVAKRSKIDALYRRDADFRAVMDSGRFVYADGHIIENSERFVREWQGRLFLTEEAARQVDLCCLRLNRQYVQRDVGEYELGRMYYDAHAVERIDFYLSDLLNEKKLNAAEARIEYIHSFPRTFAEAFDRIMVKNNETRETTAERLNMSVDTLYRMLHEPERRISFEFVVRITLMWEIPYWISGLLLERAGIHVKDYDKRHTALDTVRVDLWDRGLEEANKYLASVGEASLEGFGQKVGERRRKS